MTGEDGGLEREGVGEEFEGTVELEEVATGQIGSPNGTLEERVASKTERRFTGAFDEDAHTARRVTRGV